MEEHKPQILLWTAPEFAFRITITATVVNEARIHAVEAFYSVPRGGVEIGGVFFGVHEPDAIHIQAHRPIRCEYATGPSFTLSINDQLGLSGLLDASHTDPELAGMTPLGWYHSHTRSELFLSPIDLQLYNEFFHQKWQVAMVLRPGNLQPTKAGFFFRDRLGQVKSDAPIQEFNLDPPDFGLTLLDPYDPLAVPQKISAAAPPVTPVILPAAPAVPVVAELECARTSMAAAVAAGSLPSPAPALVTATEKLPFPGELSPVAVIAAAAGNGSVAVAAAGLVTEPLPMPALERRAEPMTKPESEAQPATESKAEPEKPLDMGQPSFGISNAAAPQKRRMNWIAGFAIVILLAAGGGAALLKWGRVANPVGLGLETYDYSGAFLIRWDRLAAPIVKATHATLEIDDGGEKIPIDLSPAELAVGGYGYMRRTARLSIHLTVDGPIPMDEYSNFAGVQVLGSKPPESPEASNSLTQALEEKEHLKTELINESIQSTTLRREIKSLRKQLADERSQNNADPLR